MYIAIAAGILRCHANFGLAYDISMTPR